MYVTELGIERESDAHRGGSPTLRRYPRRRPECRSAVPFAAFVSAVLCASALAAPRTAFSAEPAERVALIERIDRLDRDLNLLQRQVYRGQPAATGAGVEPGASPSLAGLPALDNIEIRLSTAEQQIRDLTGTTEELGHRIAVLKERLEKLSSDIDFRLTELEKARAAAVQQSVAPPPQGAVAQTSQLLPNETPDGTARPLGETPPSEPLTAQTPPAAPRTIAAQPVPADAPALPSGSPRDQYNWATQFIKQADYARAEKAFRAFLVVHPDDELAGNAQYWLGETYYVRKDYTKAAIAFADGVKKYKSGVKAPDSLLKLGMSFANLEKKPEACATFAAMAKEFPKAPANILEHATRERQRLGCK